LTENGQAVNLAVGIVTQNQLTVQYEVLTDSGQTVEDSNSHSETEATESKP